MVKADFTRDYYGDLEILPTADITEIKKQFKKLALSYHPDRNPGRESDVIAKFQRIQSAHEVLSDPQERAKYDSNRIRSNGYKAGYQGSSGVKGNPWANAGAQWAPPPKRPGSDRNPPPSAGAARYGKFETPKTSPNMAKEGAEARKKTYEAWESMKGQERQQEHAQQARAGRSSWRPPPPARDYRMPSGRDESNSYKHAPPPKKEPGFDEYRQNYSPNVSPNRRAQSTGASNRRGFQPATPGGDEPAAPKGAYFTQHKPQQAPEPPPRAPPPTSNSAQPDPPRRNAPPDPLRNFREQVDATYEPRQSAPYQTHGGEKLNPFDNANLNRSKSTREHLDRRGNPVQSPQKNSDPNLAQPHRSRSFADRPKSSMPSYTEEALNYSSSDDASNSASKSARKFAQPRRTGSSNNGQRMPEPTVRPEHTRKPSLSQFQKWYRENSGAEFPLNGIPSDGPSAGSGPANPQPSNDPNMYGIPRFHSSSSKSFFSDSNTKFNPAPEWVSVNGHQSKGQHREATKPTQTGPQPSTDSSIGNTRNFRVAFMSQTPTSETVSFGREKNLRKKSSSYSYSFDMRKFPGLFPRDGEPVVSPSGAAADRLNPFEADQRRLVDQLINKRQTSDSNTHSYSTSFSASQIPNQTQKIVSESDDVFDKRWSYVQEPVAMGSLSKKQRAFSPAHQGTQAYSDVNGRSTTEANNNNYLSRFSFKVDENTFETTNPRPNGFKSPSAEHINTKFTPEEWDGKFEAGYFNPEQKTGNVPGVPPRGRTQSSSRSRGRSPIKTQPVNPKVMQPHVEEELPVESPNGTKFTPEEWAQSFKPQTFMPPSSMPTRAASGRKGRQPSIRLTMGTAGLVDDSETTSDEKPLFTSRKPQPSPIVTSPSPDPMEVDSPPKEETPVPKTPIIDKENLTHPSPSKRPATSSQSPTDSALKVEFDDLRLRDLISHLNLPPAPEPPKIPIIHSPEHTRPPKPAYDAYLQKFEDYICAWDLFNTQFMCHILARKKQNDELGAMRWKDDAGLESYRLGLKEDKLVLGHWSNTQENHQIVMKDYAVLKERMKERGERERPRKKVY